MSQSGNKIFEISVKISVIGNFDYTDFSLFFSWLQKYEKNASKSMEVVPSNHQAIDCTYYI